MAIFLSILKIIGIILLVILALVLFLILAILFAPIHYQAGGIYREEEANYQVKVWWLLHVIHASAVGDKASPLSVVVRLFGIPVYRMGDAKVEKTDKVPLSFDNDIPEEKLVSKEIPEISDSVVEVKSDDIVENKLQNEPDIEVESIVEPAVLTEPLEEASDLEDSFEDDFTYDSDAKKNSISDRIPFLRRFRKDRKRKRKKQKKPLLEYLFSFEEKVENLFERVSDWIEHRITQLEDIDWLLHSKLFETAWKEGMNDLRKLLRRLAPKKGKGDLHFGLEDPATTAEIYGVLAMLHSSIPVTNLKQVQIRPDFDGKALDGDLTLSGRFAVFFIAVPALKLYRNKNIRLVITKFRRIING